MNDNTAVKNNVREVRFDEFSSSGSLIKATEQAHKRNYKDFLIVDVDSHHYESESYSDIFKYIENPVIRRQALESASRGGRSSMLGGSVGYQDIGGRITRHWLRKHEKTEGPQHRDITTTLRWMDAMGVDYACLFPTPMLFLGTHPQVEIEVAMARAYNSWLCETILEHEPRIISMLYLPFNDPEATYQIVKDFGHRKGVKGFMVTAPRYKPVHDNAYMKTYRLLEEMGLPISFHAAYNWNDQSLQLTNRFIGVHALGFMWFNMVHMTNWVVNGLPERFPKLKVMWIESGLTWAYSLMQRLDHSYKMRTSDCPSLKRKPSEYMREMYFSTQPMELPDDPAILEATFKMINAETQLVWSSDYPHSETTFPNSMEKIEELFAGVPDADKAMICGGRAKQLFNL